MKLWSAAEWLKIAAFVLVGVVAVLQWRRRRSESAAWLALAFGLLAAVGVIGHFIPPTATGNTIEWGRKVLVMALALFPYCLYRFASVFRGPSRRADIITKSVTTALMLATISVPSVVQPGRAFPPWFALYLGWFITGWTVLSVMAVSRLWQSGGRQPTVTGRRMRTLALAAAALNLAVLISGTSNNAKTGASFLAGQIVSSLAALLFVTGFAPPRLVRMIWRRGEVAATRRAVADLMAADTADSVTNMVLPHAAELAGGRAAVLIGVDRSVLGRHRMDQDEAAAVAARLPARSNPQSGPFVADDVVAVGLRGGWLAATIAESTPFFGPGEHGSLELLAHFAGLAWERADLFDRERLDRLALAERESQLAEAQRTAHLGSYIWDVRTDEVTWSEEMYRVLGLTPDATVDVRAAFRDRIHPDDRARVLADRASVQQHITPETISEWRMALPSGETRWVQSNVRRVVEDGVITRLCGTLQDITERRLAEGKFEGLLESAPDAIVIVGPDGRVTLVNRQTELLFGYQRDEIVGEPVEMLIPERYRHRHMGHRDGFLAAPQVRPMGSGSELFGLRRDGTEFPVEISLGPLQTDAGVLISAAIRDISERKQADALLAHQATHDTLTGLPNRVLLNDRLDQALSRVRRSGTSVAVLFLDVDRLKVVNDSRGHSAGDQLLMALGQRVRGVLRREDTLARFGGDEFVIVTECLEPDERARVLAKRITEVLSAPVEVADTEVSVSVSIGVAISGPGGNPESLLRDADAAMYKAKAHGRHGFVVFDHEMREEATERLETESHLRRAIERSELEVHYQPIINLTSDDAIGVEALVRWKHRDHWLLPPTFIAVAEETGLIVPLGAHVLRTACRDVASWHTAEEGDRLSLSVNVSARQLLSAGFLDLVHDALEHSGLDPSLLCLEITETVLLEDAQASEQALHALKDLGVCIAVDDFGTGYSSLTHLKRFPVDILKIDKSFVNGLGSSAGGDQAIVAGVIDLAHALGIAVTAEGVESEPQRSVLQALDCDSAQGFHWSRALRGSDAQRWIARRKRRSCQKEPQSRESRTVVIVDDERSARQLLRLGLDDSGMEVVGEGADGREAVALARRHQPDLLLLDLAMPGLGGIEALPLIQAVAPHTKVVIISALEPHDIKDRLSRHSTAGYITKGQDPEHLVANLAQML